MSRLERRQKTQSVKAAKRAEKLLFSVFGEPPEAYSQGRDAYGKKSRNDNPYNITSMLAWHEFWDTGWCYSQYIKKG